MIYVTLVVVQGTEKEGAFHEGCATFLYPLLRSHGNVCLLKSITHYMSLLSQFLLKFPFQ